MAINKGQAPVVQQGWLRAIIFCAAYILATYLAGLIANNFGTILVLLLLVIAIISIALSIIFRLYVDRKPVASLGFDRYRHRNDAWTGLLLSVVLLGIGSLVLYFSGTLRWVDARFEGSEFFMATV